MIINIIALMYTVTTVLLPAQTFVDLPLAGGAPFGSYYEPATSMALSHQGSFAAVIHPQLYAGYSGDAGYNGKTALLIIRADGTRFILSRPRTQDVTGNDRNTFDFRAVALAEDGTPFTTVSFAGGVLDSSRTDRVYKWDGQWHDELENKSLPIDSTNSTIAAAATPTRFACNGNYADTIQVPDQAEQDAHYEEYQALLVDGTSLLSLGYGSVTAMRGEYTVGYDASVRAIGVSSGGAGSPTHALKWTNGRRTLLGPGIAFAVNAQGDTVGDNEPIYSEPGVPMLWRRGHAIRLSGTSGVAYAIGDDGTIVGRVGSAAFLVRGADSTRKSYGSTSLLDRPAGISLRRTQSPATGEF